MNQEIVSKHVTVTGVVQGVGYRPFVYNLAVQLGLRGWVLNHSGGVEIEVEGPPGVVASFVTALRDAAPPLAHVESVTAVDVPERNFEGFEIRRSERQAGRYQLISPDVATCPDCVRELFDPADPRYRYPFINCTNCGPRYTIIADIPYDRPNTTMRVFPLCERCHAEYEDPADRRFHAQPNACPVCGPHVWLTDTSGEPLVGDAARGDTDAVLAAAREMLLAGEILAVKGLGGFHLACDATNPEAVQKLRDRKRRPHKPFAVMVPTLAEARAHCEVLPAAETLLTSVQAPIVLMPRRPGSTIVEAVAPHAQTLGLMLPYTPLHHLLLHDVGRPLVMTSGNVTEEPIAKDNDEALRRLAPLADAFLLHNRDIYARYDDAVWQVIPLGEGIPQPVRRARGYAPFPVRLPFEVERIFAVGPLLKNTFCLTRDQYAFLSPHIGDVETLETLEHYEATLAVYRHLFRLEPELVARDLHPDYLTTDFARRFAEEEGLPEPYPVQHHRAHVAGCLVDNERAEDADPVIGVTLDGTGYGDDGAIWGGEWFAGDYREMRRVAHLEYLPLPGGAAAIRHPWRIAAAYLHALLPPEEFPAGEFCPAEAGLIRQQVERRINTPLTSSMGRLFDAASALLGVCRDATYEAQAAIELEQAATTAEGAPEEPYPFNLEDEGGVTVIRVARLFEALLDEKARGTPVAEVAYRFHVTVARMVLRVCETIRAAEGLATVALSGGVFQNVLLLKLLLPLLEGAGFEVLLHQRVPSNDGGIALGQAVVAHFDAVEKDSVEMEREVQRVSGNTDEN